MAQLVAVDHDPFADAPQSTGPKLVAVDHDPFAETTAAKPQAELRAYEPTVLEKIGHWIAGDDPNGKDSFIGGLRGKIANAAVGSDGLGYSDAPSALDVATANPIVATIAAPLYAQRAVRSFEEGKNLQGTLEAAGAAIPLAAPAIRGAAGIAARRAEAAIPALEAAERAGVTLPRGLDSKAAALLKEAPIPSAIGGNPIVAKAEKQLADLDAALVGTAKANAGRSMGGQSALRDWLLSVDDDAAKAASEAVEAAPVPKPVAPSETQIAVPGFAAGDDGAFRVVTPDNSMEISAKPQLVELSELKFAGGQLQPRDRSRVEYTAEMLERANRLDPEQLRPSRVSDSGAPIVNADGTIISGNGRARSIAQVYSNPALKDKADAYRASLGPEAANMRQPVVVMRAGDIAPDEAAKFADLSNRGRIASMSATERAARDANALGSDGVSLFQGGDFEAPQNQAFLRNFMENVATSGERTAMSKGGRLTQEGAARMRNAVLASAYDDADLLSRMLESSDDNIRNLTGALSDAAPKFAGLKADIKAGIVTPDMDAAPQIVAAVKKIADLRNNGTTAERWFAQMDAFDDTDPVVKEWVRAFHTDDLARPASRQRMSEVLDAYAEEARKHAPGGLFDDPTTSGDVLTVARRSTNANSESAGAVAVNQTASDGAGDAAGRAQAQRLETQGGGSEPVRAREPVGNGTGAETGGQSARETRSLANYVPKPKTAQEIILEAKKTKLGGVLGIKGDVRPSTAFDRIEELARSGTAQDTSALMSARSLLGADAWQDVSGSVLTRFGLGSDLYAFAKTWEALPLNGRNALVSGETRQALDDVVTLLGKRDSFKRLSDTATKRNINRLGSVPIVGGLLAGMARTKIGDAAIHVAMGSATGGGTVPASLAARAAGAFLMRPASAKATARWLSTLDALSSERTARNATAFALASRMLAKVVSDESGSDERDVSAALQSAGGE